MILIFLEMVLYSDKIIKINRYGMSQERNIVITNRAAYNFKKKDLKRRIDLYAFRGITVSRTSEELVIHGNDLEYDYNYISSKRQLIVQFIAEAYFKLKNTSIPFCEVDEKSLKNYVTLKDEKKKDLNFSRMQKTGLIDVTNYYIHQDELEFGDRLGVLKTLTNEKDKGVYLTDFKVIKLIGIGYISKVFMIEHISTGKIYSMKVMNKDNLLDLDQIENALMEKKILGELEHPFIISLNFSFQTPEKICFVLPFLPGGDLFFHLNQRKKFNEELVRFFTSQVSLALSHLHGYGVIYRDLKPENIVVDEKGYIKLVDFGLSKKLKLNEKAFSLCGTPEYHSPEVITGQGYSKSSDWWALGMLIYELLIGKPAFYSDEIERIYDLILYADVKFPVNSFISPIAKDIIIKLLDKNQDTRLGSKSGLVEIQKHPFFSEINFDDIYANNYKSMLIPCKANKYDTSNIDINITEMLPDVIESVKNPELIRLNQDKFINF